MLPLSGAQIHGFILNHNLWLHSLWAQISCLPLAIVKASVKWFPLNVTSVSFSCFLLISWRLPEQLNQVHKSPPVTVCKINLHPIHQYWTPNVFLLVCCFVVSLYHYKMITYGMPLKNMMPRYGTKRQWGEKNNANKSILISSLPLNTRLGLLWKIYEASYHKGGWITAMLTL